MKNARAIFLNVVKIYSKVIGTKWRPNIMPLMIQMRKDCAIDFHTYWTMSGGDSSMFGQRLRQR